MKKTIVMAMLSAATAFGTMGHAGSLDPVVEEPVIIADAQSSSSGTALVLLLAVTLAIPVLSD